jgi:hypothetical protein
MTTYKRPDYTRQVLEGLNACEGIGEYGLIIQLDGCNGSFNPVSLELRGISERYPNIKKARCDESFINRGCGNNTLMTLELGFDIAQRHGNDFNIHIEDDVVPHKDFLRYMEWACEKYRDDKSVFSIGAHWRGMPPKDEFFQVWRDKMFTPWGWGTWRDRFEEMKANWIQNEGVNHSWDTHLRDLVRGDRVCIRPKLSRTQYIGRDGGTWGTAEFFDAQYSKAEGVWSVDLGEGKFHES